MTLLAAALFLPLFPLSVLLGGLFVPLRNPFARAALLLVWPHLGVALLHITSLSIPPAFVGWALLSAGFYALRLLTVRDMGRWATFLALSALPLTWALAASGAGQAELHLYAFWFSLPSALVILFARPLTTRFGAAYAGLQGGLIAGLPRLSGVLALTVLAAIATPPFPGFFALLHLMQQLEWIGAAGVLLIWLVWGWAATRLLHGFIFGSGPEAGCRDIGRIPAYALAGTLVLFAAAGLSLTGGGL